MENFAFMKTGLLEGAPSALENLQFDLVSLYLKMVTKAAENALVYSEHENRSVVTKNDVLMALRHQAKFFIHNMDDDTLYEARGELKQILQGEEEEDEEDEEEDDDEPMDQEGIGPCDCALCDEIRVTTDTWDTWNTEDPVLQYLKQQVDNVANM